MVKVKLIAATLTNRVFVKCFEMIKTDKTWKETAKWSNSGYEAHDRI